jgi:RNA polymerase sigma factor (TIGR02999 family)
VPDAAHDQGSDPPARSRATDADLSAILAAAGAGDQAAAERILPLVYDELRAQAERFLRGERRGHTLQPTALVHEAYLRLAEQTRVQWKSRVHFLAVAATMMRRILVNHARSRSRQKRGGEALRLTFDEGLATESRRELDLVALDEALERLGAIDAQQARLVELRFFAGMTAEEAAAALGISERTAHRDWAMAKAWLHAEIGKGDA